MTTENVAVLFTDMVGSTVLASSLSPDAADELRREHFSTLRQAIAESGGTEVKNLGDGVMVVFGSASASLSCAVAMQQGIERDNRAREQSVGLRVGLSIGEVTTEDDDYFGDPVIEAARLCAQCESGQVLAADVLRLMAGRRTKHECRAVGELTLKGLSDPVATVEVRWEPLGATDTGTVIPLPGRLAVRPAVGVVGRDAEAVLLADAFNRVAAGEGREVLLISGEAGLGKTALVAEAARAAFDAGACVLFGHCEEDLATPYQLFAEVLAHYAMHAPEDQLVAHVASGGSELVRLVPALASRMRDLPPSKATDADTERFLLFAAVVGLLALASQQQAVVVVLDDLQWADTASLLLLRHLAASDVAMRVLVIGTYRDSELSPSHPLLDTLATLRRQPRVSRIELAGLGDTGVVAFLEAAAGHALDDAGLALAHALYRETDGNPFFVTEVLLHLTETGAISQAAGGGWAVGDALEQIALPDSVREVIGARVGRLGADAERVLSMAAVIGRDFDLDLLASATETSEDAVLDMLEAATAASLVRELADTPGHYNFAHALIQHTLYEDMTLTRRARAHRRVAEALEVLCGDRTGARVGELARHWFNGAQPVDLIKAINYSRLAGDAAVAALAPADALRYYSQALDLYPQVADPDPVLGLDLAIGLGIAQRQTGDPAYRQTLLDAARRAAALSDTDRLVAAALANNRGYYSSANAIDADRVEMLELALARLSANDRDRALVLATLCSELTQAADMLERRQALGHEAVAIAERFGDDATIVRVLNVVRLPPFAPSLLEQSLVRAVDALTRAERLGDPVLLAFAAAWRAIAAVRAADIDEVDRCFEIFGSLVAQLDQPFLNLQWCHLRSMRALIAGDTAHAEQLAAEALQIARETGEPDAATMCGLQFASASRQRGTMGDLIPTLERVPPGTPLHVGGSFSLLALAYAEADRTDDARQQLAKFAAARFEIPMRIGWVTAMVAYTDAAIACRDPQYAAPIFARLAPNADQWSTLGSTSEGPVSGYLGGLASVLALYDEADMYFTQAAATCDRIGAKFDAARNNLLWGKMLAERGAPGDAEKARALLTNAHTAAAAHGYANVERRAADALQHLD